MRSTGLKKEKTRNSYATLEISEVEGPTEKLPCSPYISAEVDWSAHSWSWVSRSLLRREKENREKRKWKMAFVCTEKESI